MLDTDDALVALWIASVAVFVTLTVLPVWQHRAWWVRVWEFPRMQACACGFVLVTLSLLLVEMREPLIVTITAACVACLAWHLWWILPYTRLYNHEVPDQSQTPAVTTISLLTANVLTPNRRADRLLLLVRCYRPDVILTLETDDWWENQLSPLLRDYPHTICCPQGNLYGMHLFSRRPMVDPKIQFLVQSDIPSMHTKIDMGNGLRVRAHFLDPAPPSPTENVESTERDAELLVVGRSIRNYREPVLVAGDLNDVAWSKTSLLFRKISTLLDPRIGRGLFNTFHAKIPVVRFPLDHIFVSAHFLVRRLERLPAFGSDHFAIYAEFALVAARDGGQRSRFADSEDLDQARDAMAASDVQPEHVHVPKESAASQVRTIDNS